MQSLSEVKTGVVCTIKWMSDNPQIMEFIHQHDIEEGSVTNVFQHGRDSMIIGVDNVHLAIGNEVAERIKVRSRPSISRIRGISGLKSFFACRMIMQLIPENIR